MNLRFLYGMCKDVQAVRAFYSDAIGLQEQHFMDEERFGCVIYKSEGMEYMFFRWDEGEVPAPEGWAWQPGDGVGQTPVMSISIQVPEEEFRDVVGRLRESDCPKMSDHPTWRQDSSWGWTVRDPAGTTIEVYATPAKRPELTDWLALIPGS
jgi:catechol 2,3-dioxygenase-like lactoylglutathione lyase family enzyme